MGGNGSLVAYVRAECPTCRLVAPVLDDLAERAGLRVVSEDSDEGLRASWAAGVEIVPTLVRADGERLSGWSRPEWERFTGIAGLGAGLPPFKPGCGARAVEPEVARDLARRFGSPRLSSRLVELPDLEDELESAYEHGWSDGLPVVPPTADRVLAMLEGTARRPDEVVAVVPPDLVECTVEKVAVNAVMAGCRPEYLPVVLAAVEAACTDAFNMHGLLATTWFVGPVVIVNGPVRRRLGMNSGVNVFGPGNRANATIGRALQLVARNVGGGRPGEVDRATFGNPGKYTFCFAENEEDSPWEPLSVERGLAPGVSAITLFGGYGVHPVADGSSRTAEALTRSLADGLARVSPHAVLVVAPDHARRFREAGWTRRDLRKALAAELGRGVDDLLLVHAGGGAGFFSAILPGWVGGAEGSQPVTVAVDA